MSLFWGSLYHLSLIQDELYIVSILHFVIDLMLISESLEVRFERQEVLNGRSVTSSYPGFPRKGCNKSYCLSLFVATREYKSTFSDNNRNGNLNPTKKYCPHFHCILDIIFQIPRIKIQAAGFHLKFKVSYIHIFTLCRRGADIKVKILTIMDLIYIGLQRAPDLK